MSWEFSTATLKWSEANFSHCGLKTKMSFFSEQNWERRGRTGREGRKAQLLEENYILI